MAELTITEDDVHSFQAKLAAWGETLSDNERAILNLIAVRAFPEHEPDVEGFMQDFHFVGRQGAGEAVGSKAGERHPEYFPSAALNGFVGLTFTSA